MRSEHYCVVVILVVVYMHVAAEWLSYRERHHRSRSVSSAAIIGSPLRPCRDRRRGSVRECREEQDVTGE